ncbi:hypothetical protein [Anaerospora sp.]|uniref:hypothetical protein n=1 Tax=Anaerospora sp. TaxID=1960278 RepID=UPI00289F4A8F|nr:hypothetical protein [Anaerospora sp.]
MWTIFNSQQKAISNCDYEPNQEELTLRDEKAVYHEELIPLQEAFLNQGNVKRKPSLRLTAEKNDFCATITITCEDQSISEVPLSIAGTAVTKPLGSFQLFGEPSATVKIDFDTELFCGEPLEVNFDA